MSEWELIGVFVSGGVSAIAAVWFGYMIRDGYHSND